MSKKYLALLLALSLLVGFISAQDYQTPTQEWNNMPPEKKLETNPNKFIQEKGVNSISGDMDGVSYDRGANSITNGDITLSISDIQGADVKALEGGGFKVTKPGKMTIAGNTYELGDGQSINLNKDGTIGLQQGSVMKTNGRTINPEGDVTVRSSKDRLTTTGPSTITTEDGRIVKGSDLTLYFSESLPDKSITQIRKGNQVYLAENNRFMLKGNAEISTTVDGITNRYQGQHPKTLIWTGEGNIVSIRNPENFDMKTTIARSWHDVEIKNTKTRIDEIKTIEFRYSSINNRISASVKATALGDLGYVSKLNYEVTKHPNVNIDIGDNRFIYLDQPSIIKKNNLLVDLHSNPKNKIVIDVTSEQERNEEGKALRFTLERGPSISTVEVKTDPEKLQNLIAKYQGYVGPVEERNEDFINELMSQPGLMSMQTKAEKANGIEKWIGTGIIQNSFRETGKDAGLKGQDWKNFDYIVGKYKIGGPPIIMDNANPDNAIISIGKKSRPISIDGINRVKEVQIGIFLRKEEAKAQFPKVTNELLK